MKLTKGRQRKWGKLSLCLGPGTEACLGAALIAGLLGGPVGQLIREFAGRDALRVIAEAGWGVERRGWRGGGRRAGGAASGTCGPISPALPQFKDQSWLPAPGSPVVRAVLSRSRWVKVEGENYSSQREKPSRALACCSFQ